jgi:hypothetical protein
MDLSKILKQIVKIAVRNIGYGEVGENNKGKFVEAIGGIQGDAWCAAFGGWCYETAFKECGEVMPIKRSLGAKKMGKLIAEYGTKFTDVRLAKPGDVMILNRGLLDWQGHFAIIESVKDGLVHTIEGNVGAFPSRVKRLVRDPSKSDLSFFATLRKL